jgi:hypothetical protein
MAMPAGVTVMGAAVAARFIVMTSGIFSFDYRSAIGIVAYASTGQVAASTFYHLLQIFSVNFVTHFLAPYILVVILWLK